MLAYEEERRTDTHACRLGEVMKLIIPDGKSVMNKKPLILFHTVLESESEKVLGTSRASNL